MARGRCLKHEASPVGEPLRVLLHGLSCEAGPESTPEHGADTSLMKLRAVTAAQ